MPTYAIDYSYARPNPAAVKAAGYDGVLRYLSGGTPTKDLTADEATKLRSAGLWVAVVWETSAQRATAGEAAGRADAAAAVAQVKGIGYPAGCVIFVNVGDWAVTTAQAPAVKVYYDGFAAVVRNAGYQPGGYGPGWIIAYLVANGSLGWWWENAMNDNGTPGTNVNSHACLYQDTQHTLPLVAGSAPSDYDQDVVISPFPAWGSQAAATPAEAQAAPLNQPSDIQGENVKQLIAAVPIGADGRGEAIFDGGTNTLKGIASVGPAIAYDTFLAATAYGPCVGAGDTDYDGRVEQQNRNGFLYLAAHGFPPGPGGEVVMRDVATVIYAG